MHPMRHPRGMAVTAIRLRQQLKAQARKPVPKVVAPVPEIILPLVVPTCITQPIPDLSLGIITADRQDDMLISTIRSIRATGFTQPIHVFSQAIRQKLSRLNSIDNNLVCTHTVTAAGCYYNWNSAARRLLKLQTKWVMIMQDDIVWCKQGANVLYKTLNDIDAGISPIKREELGLLSPYTSPAMLADTTKGWVEARYYGHIKGLWGALALCFTHESLKATVNNKRFLGHNCPRALDYIIGDSLRFHMQPPLAVKVHVPSLVDHTGDKSTIYSAHAVSAPGLNRLRHGYEFNMNYEVPGGQ